MMSRISRQTLVLPLVTLTSLVASGTVARAQTIAATYSGSYTVGYNGPAGNIATNYGGLIFKQGDTNTLLLMGAANGGGGTLFSVPVNRGVGGHITGFGATATVLAAASNNDGGLVYGPNGTLLYTRYSTNEIGEIKPGSNVTDKVVALPNASTSVGTLQYVPAGFSNAGQLKIVSYSNASWFDAVLSPDGSGTYNVAAAATGVTTSGGPEGIVYVRSGNPGFSVNSILVSEFSSNLVSSYTADANGNPIPASRQDFITGLTGAEGGTVDPVTGDFVFSTFGGSNHVVVVQGFTKQVTSTPEPGSIALLVGAGLSGSVFAFRRRRNRK